MKIVSPLPHKRGRLEIIPLIDIMFFLLAAFMVVSIGKIHVKSLKVNLPTDVPAAQKEAKEDFVTLSISADGIVQLDKEVVPTKDALLAKLQELYATNKEQKFLISADRDTRHGDIMDVLGRLRSAGFQKIGFATKSEQLSGPSAGVEVSAAANTISPAASAPAPSTLVPPADGTASSSATSSPDSRN
jgi:biopolymer transport protein ExbD